MSAIGFTLFGFFLGAVPFAFYLTHLLRGRDIREIADGNPGATNAWRAGGPLIGALAYFLEVGKGVVPVILAAQLAKVQGWWLVPVALAPTIGHIFSPFLRWRGGRGLATMLGIWIGLSIWEMPLVIIVLVVPLYLWMRRPGLAVLLTAGGAFLYLLLFHRQPIWMITLFLQSLLVLFTHRSEFFAKK